MLMKGLNFSVAPYKIPVADIIAATEHACSQLKDKSLKSEIVKIVSTSEPPRSNISKAEREAINSLGHRGAIEEKIMTDLL